MEKWLDPKTIAIWIIIAAVMVSLLTVSIVKLVYINVKRQVESKLKESRLQLEYQKKLMETSVVVQERERARVAADLHDSLIGKLTILRLKNQIEYNFDETDRLLEESINEARRVSHDLSPPMLDDIELCDLIENMEEAWKKHLSILFHKDIRTATPHPGDVKLQVTRILQELIVNCNKHAEATAVFIGIRITDNCISMVVRDNGKGFDVEAMSQGLGMKNIELRVLYLKGVYKIKSGEKGTTSVFVFDLKNRNKS